MRGPVFSALIGLALAPTVVRAQAGATSSTATVALTAIKVSALSVTVNSGATASIASITDGAINAFPTPVNITTAWNLHPSTARVVLVAYFASPASALANGTATLPSSRVEGRLGTSGAFAAFTGGVVTGGAASVGVAGGSLQLFSQNITGANRTSSRTDDLYLQLNLVGATTLPGTYTGTLTLRAITQ